MPYPIPEPINPAVLKQEVENSFKQGELFESAIAFFQNDEFAIKHKLRLCLTGSFARKLTLSIVHGAALASNHPEPADIDIAITRDVIDPALKEDFEQGAFEFFMRLRNALSKDTPIRIESSSLRWHQMKIQAFDFILSYEPTDNGLISSIHPKIDVCNNIGLFFNQATYNNFRNFSVYIPELGQLLFKKEWIKDECNELKKTFIAKNDTTSPAWSAFLARTNELNANRKRIGHLFHATNAVLGLKCGFLYAPKMQSILVRLNTNSAAAVALNELCKEFVQEKEKKNTMQSTNDSNPEPQASEKKAKSPIKLAIPANASDADKERLQATVNKHNNAIETSPTLTSSSSSTANNQNEELLHEDQFESSSTTSNSSASKLSEPEPSTSTATTTSTKVEAAVIAQPNMTAPSLNALHIPFLKSKNTKKSSAPQILTPTLTLSLSDNFATFTDNLSQFILQCQNLDSDAQKRQLQAASDKIIAMTARDNNTITRESLENFEFAINHPIWKTHSIALKDARKLIKSWKESFTEENEAVTLAETPTPVVNRTSEFVAAKTLPANSSPSSTTSTVMTSSKTAAPTASSSRNNNNLIKKKKSIKDTWSGSPNAKSDSVTDNHIEQIIIEEDATLPTASSDQLNTHIDIEVTQSTENTEIESTTESTESTENPKTEPTIASTQTKQEQPHESATKLTMTVERPYSTWVPRAGRWGVFAALSLYTYLVPEELTSKKTSERHTILYGMFTALLAYELSSEPSAVMYVAKEKENFEKNPSWGIAAFTAIVAVLRLNPECRDQIVAGSHPKTKFLEKVIHIHEFYAQIKGRKTLDLNDNCAQLLCAIAHCYGTLEKAAAANYLFLAEIAPRLPGETQQEKQRREINNCLVTRNAARDHHSYLAYMAQCEPQYFYIQAFRAIKIPIQSSTQQTIVYLNVPKSPSTATASAASAASATSHKHKNHKKHK